MSTQEWMMLDGCIEQIAYKTEWVWKHHDTSTAMIRKLDVEELINVIGNLQSYIPLLEKLK